MTFLQLYTDVFRLMRDVDQTKYDLATIKADINQAERLFCQFTDYSVKKSTSTTTANGTREYAVPTDFSKEIEIYWNSLKLKKIRMDQTIHASGQMDGDPDSFYIENQQIGLEPVPTTAQTLTIVYHSIGGAMTGDSDEPIIPAEYQKDALEMYPCMRAAIEGEDDRLEIFAALHRRTLERGRRMILLGSKWPQIYDHHEATVDDVDHDLVEI